MEKIIAPFVYWAQSNTEVKHKRTAEDCKKLTIASFIRSVFGWTYVMCLSLK